MNRPTARRHQAMVAAMLGMIAVGGSVAVAAPVAHVPVDLGSFNYNLRIQSLSGAAAQFPEGRLVTGGGVPFRIRSGTTNAWSAHGAIGGGFGVAALTLPTNFHHLSRVQVLLNTYWGQPGPDAYARIEVETSDGIVLQKHLVGNADIREYLLGDYTNIITSFTTQNVFTAGSGYRDQVRLDRITFELPGLGNKRITKLRVLDVGAPDVHRSFVTGVTVSVDDPLPGDADLNGIVNFTDLLAIAQNYNLAQGAFWSDGDFDANGKVNFTDLLTLAGNYGSNAPAGPANASSDAAGAWTVAQGVVPEPLASGFLTAAVMLVRRRPRARPAASLDTPASSARPFCTSAPNGSAAAGV